MDGVKDFTEACLVRALADFDNRQHNERVRKLLTMEPAPKTLRWEPPIKVSAEQIEAFRRSAVEMPEWKARRIYRSLGLIP